LIRTLTALALLSEPFALSQALAADGPSSRSDIRRISESNELPIFEQETEIHDPNLGDIKVTFDYGVAENEDQDRAGREWLKHTVKSDAAAGDETGLIELTVDNDSSDSQLNIDPIEWGVQPENVARPILKLGALQEFRGWLAEKYDAARDFAQKKAIDWRAEKADQEKARTEALAAGQTLTRFDAYLKNLNETEIEMKVPALVRIGHKVLTGKEGHKTKPVRKYARTFARARFAVVGGAVALGMYFSREMSLQTALATLTTAVTFGYLSRTIQLFGAKYMTWLGHVGQLSKWVIRGPVRGAARFSGYMAGLDRENRDLMAEALDQKTRGTKMHNLLHSGLKFTITEVPFMAMMVVIFEAFGEHYYPIVDVANHINFTSSELFPLNYLGFVAYSIMSSCIKAFTSQGLLDIANSNVRAGEIHDVATLATHKLLPTEVVRSDIQRIEFKSNSKMLVVSAASNFAVVLAQTPMPMLQNAGNMIVTGMTGLGAVYYTYSVAKFDPSFRAWLKTKSPRLSSSIFGGKNYDYESCIDLFRPKKRS
jgi:hypothetical protein